MRKMKDSGVDWIGAIPEDWNYSSLKYICSMQSGKNLVAEQILPQGDFPVYGGNGIRGYFSEYNEDGKNILVGRQGALCGNVHRVNEKIYATEHAVVTKNKSFIDFDFLYWLLLSMNLNQYASATTAQPGLAVNVILNVKACFPDISEQESIGKYLNKKCSQLDYVIEKQNQVIEKLKAYKLSVITEALTKGLTPNDAMKDSGIEWIGEIKESYHIYKMKYILKSSLQYGAGESGISYEENLPRYVRITDITAEGNLKEENKLSLPENIAEPYILEDGDILFARSGATVGKSFIYKAEYGKAAFAGYLIRAKVNSDKILPMFAYYYTCSGLYETWKNGIFVQATIQNIGADKYSNMPIVVPDSLEEQQMIVDYLDKKCAAIDSSIAKRQQLIDKLTEYKKSLIFEVVTGKKEV